MQKQTDDRFDAVSTADSAGTPATPFISPKLLFAIIAAIMVGHMAIRLLMTPMALLDESWQLVLGQQWERGYYSHPPLYTWLQIICFRIFGESLLSLSILKHALLFGLYAVTYACAKQITKRTDHAVFATLCLLVIPQIAWESHRELTHSVLLTTALTATVYCFLKAAEIRSPGWHAALGLCAGCALLSKYNAAIFLLAGVVAALLVPTYRRVLLHPKMIIALVFCVHFTLPHWLWAVNNSAEAFASASKLGMNSEQSWSGAIGRTLGRFANGFFPNLIPMAVVYVLARQKPFFRARNDTVRLLLLVICVSGLIALTGMVVTKATGMRGRWFQPLFAIAPLVLIAQLQYIPRWLNRFVTVVALTAAVSVMGMMAVRATGRGGSQAQDLTPATLDNVRAAAGERLHAADAIVADSFWSGGNMRLEYRRPVITPQAPAPLTGKTNVLVIFDARRSKTPSDDLRAFITRQIGRPVSFEVIHLTPSVDRRITGLPLGVAAVRAE